MDRDDHAALDRREFLRRLALLGIGVAAGAPRLRALPDTPPGGPPRRMEARRALGTRLEITLIDPSPGHARTVLEACFREVDRLEGILSRHRAGTPVWRLNRDGRLAGAPPELREVVRRAIAWHDSTGGLFDITVEPLVTLCREHFGRYRTPPPEAALAALLPRIGTSLLRLEGGQIAFARPGMGITLDGIAKGYVVDRAVEVARGSGVEHVLVNAGGDIRVAGGRESGLPWSIAVQDPFREAATIDTLSLAGGAVASSGNYRIYYDEEKLFHHIVDPRDGRSPVRCAGTTVRADSAAEADALATALFVMDPGEGRRHVEAQPRAEALIVTRSGRALETTGWRSAG